MQQNAFLLLNFLQIETGTSFIGELNESAKKKGGHRRFDGVVAGEASTTLPGLWCECAKSRAARQNRRGQRRRRGRLSTVPSGPDPVRSLTIKFERNRWRWSQMARAFGRSISHAVPSRRISTPFTEIGRDEGVNRGMSF